MLQSQQVDTHIPTNRRKCANFWATTPLTHSYCDLLQEVITQPKLYIIRVHISLASVIIRDGKMTQSRWTLVSAIRVMGKGLPYFWIVSHDITLRLPVTTCSLQSRILFGNENITDENSRMEQKNVRHHH